MLNFRVGGRHGGGWVHSRFLLFGIGGGGVGGGGRGLCLCHLVLGWHARGHVFIGLDFSN
jgi:hypothetical protein